MEVIFASISNTSTVVYENYTRCSELATHLNTTDSIPLTTLCDLSLKSLSTVLSK